ncbi:unnamed protein product, partial [Laminaria digitata]
MTIHPPTYSHVCSGTCVDADFMTMTSGVCLARLEVEGDWRAEEDDVIGHERDDQHAMPATKPSPQSRLTDFLTVGLTDFLSTEDDRKDACGDHNLDQAAFSGFDNGPYRGGGGGRGGDDCSSSGSDGDDHAAPCKKAKATEGAGAGAGAPPTIPSRSSATVCPHCPSSARGGGGSGGGDAQALERDQQERAALTAAAFEQAPVAPEQVAPILLSGGVAGEEGSRRSSSSSGGGGSACSPPLGEPRSSHGCGGGGGDAAASGCLRRERVRLARRAGRGFLAESDASVSSDVTVSSSGGISSEDSDS